jgi:hypothetical protein
MSAISLGSIPEASMARLRSSPCYRFPSLRGGRSSPLFFLSPGARKRRGRRSGQEGKKDIPRGQGGSLEELATGSALARNSYLPYVSGTEPLRRVPVYLARSSWAGPPPTTGKIRTEEDDDVKPPRQRRGRRGWPRRR